MAADRAKSQKEKKHYLPMVATAAVSEVIVPAVRVTVTRGGSPEAFALMHLVANGAVFGTKQPVTLRAHDKEKRHTMLRARLLELKGSGFTTLRESESVREGAEGALRVRRSGAHAQPARGRHGRRRPLPAAAGGALLGESRRGVRSAQAQLPAIQTLRAGASPLRLGEHPRGDRGQARVPVGRHLRAARGAHRARAPHHGRVAAAGGARARSGGGPPQAARAGHRHRERRRLGPPARPQRRRHARRALRRRQDHGHDGRRALAARGHGRGDPGAAGREAAAAGGGVGGGCVQPHDGLVAGHAAVPLPLPLAIRPHDRALQRLLQGAPPHVLLLPGRRHPRQRVAHRPGHGPGLVHGVAHARRGGATEAATPPRAHVPAARARLRRAALHVALHHQHAGRHRIQPAAQRRQHPAQGQAARLLRRRRRVQRHGIRLQGLGLLFRPPLQPARRGGRR